MADRLAAHLERTDIGLGGLAGLQRRSDWLTSSVVVGSVRVLDSAIVAVSGILAYWLCFLSLDAPPTILVTIIMATLLATNCFQLSGVYEMTKLSDLIGQISRVPLAWVMLFVTLALIGFLSKTLDDFSRFWILLWFAFGIGLTMIFRICVHGQLHRWRRIGLLARNVVVVGADAHGRRLVEHLHRNNNAARLIGLFDDRKDRVPDHVCDFPVLGTVEDLLIFARRNRIDQIIVALPWKAEERIMSCMKKLKSLPIDVRLCPDLVGLHLPHRGITDIGGMPLINIFEKPLTGWNFVIKCIEDRLLTAAILIVIAPLMAMIALAVKLSSPGPVIFKQKRYGFNNELIEVFKFRTMHQDRGQQGDGVVEQATKFDPRVTPIGRFLRRTSLDELPQFINVLRGEMSIVGPRPHAVSHNERYARLIDEYLARHRMRPGITGWAQINGYRGETDTLDKMEKRVQHDLFYIENWSLMLDFKIICTTLFVGFSSPNAY